MTLTIVPVPNKYPGRSSSNAKEKGYTLHRVLINITHIYHILYLTFGYFTPVSGPSFIDAVCVIFGISTQCKMFWVTAWGIVTGVHYNPISWVYPCVYEIGNTRSDIQMALSTTYSKMAIPPHIMGTAYPSPTVIRQGYFNFHPESIYVRFCKLWHRYIFVSHVWILQPNTEGCQCPV